MYYLYILYSASSDKYYIGYSNDPNRRLQEHNSTDRVTYTSKYRPWVLVKAIVISETRSFAMKIEKTIKRTKSRKIISETNNIDELAQLVRVPMNWD
ncbi:GIY-YIG nuclease family protein [Pedobacter sp. GSP4]|uniref:GIY-YIG nuclease family protein n=1 Tax=Pedobacter sp. GSP4 TaxID=3453716 RepID=UPI003EEF07C7